jgi:Poly A polymerase head domain
MRNANIQTHVENTLNHWPGYTPLSDALRRLPDLQIYLGGGVVRQALLGKHRGVKDFDIFVDGPCIDALVERLGRAGRVEHGPYGSPRWFPTPAGSAYADLIPIRRFNNGLWPCENIVDVLNQVDFTLNALAMDLRTGEVFDPQNGQRDAQRRIMRAVRFDRPGDPIRPEIPLSHRAALWHRLLHYASVLQLRIESVTLRWLHANRPSESDSRQFAQWFFTPVLDLLEPTAAIGKCVAA